jgi:hypothetical protein
LLYKNKILIKGVILLSNKNTERDNLIIKLYTKDKLSTCKIEKLINISRPTISKILNKYNIPIRKNKTNSRKYTVNNDYFNIIDSEEKAYWLGFIYADGYLTESKYYNQKNIGIVLEIKDYKHLEKYNKSLNSTYPIKIYTATTNYKTYTYGRVLITSDKLFNDLLELNVYKNKSNILTFPNNKIVPTSLLNHFIRGYIDGDGSITISNQSNNKKYFTISVCGTKEFLNELVKILNINSKIEYRYPQTKKGSYIRINNNIRVENILNYVYNNATIYLDRKFERYKLLKEYNKANG